MADIDWGDPCAALAVLRPAYYALLAGDKAVSVAFHDRHVTYQQAQLAQLRDEVSRLEASCAAKTSATGRRRFAMTAGTRRSPRGC